MRLTPPVIVIPGITASTLRDYYALDADVIWSMLPMSRSYERVTPHPEDRRYEALEPARVAADRLFTLPYDDFISELRYNLRDREDAPIPVYPFAYDWRRPLHEVQTELTAFIEEVIDRTALMRHYYEDGYTTASGAVDLVGHSMGGLIIAGYLAAADRQRVRKVATLGTPFRGSHEAVIKIATGTAQLGPGRPTSREREAARVTPALYHLIPSYPGAVTAERAEWADLFDVRSWQHGVLETIAEHIRLVGRDRALDDPARTPERLALANAVLAEMLRTARDHRDAIDSFVLAAAGLEPSDWLCIIGVGERTRTGLRITSDPRRPDQPYFDLDGSLRKNGYPHGRGALPTETGDATVPYLGATPTFLGVERLVCVCDADFGYWELRDRGAEALGVGLHGLLPAMNLVQRLVVSHLRGRGHEPGQARPGTWGRRPPDLPRGVPWQPPIAGLKAKA